MNLSKLQHKLPDAVFNELDTIVNKYHGNTPLRMAHFLAQCSHESNSFALTKENLNYSANGLLSVFHKYFPTEALAKEFERQPERIGNKVYANRMGNGDEASGDGFRYRGRGYIQLTGKDNYKAFQDSIGEVLMGNPELVATKYPLASAGFFFNKNNIWAICDEGSTEEVVKKVSKRVNGGLIGIDDRIKKFSIFSSLLL